MARGGTRRVGQFLGRVGFVAGLLWVRVLPFGLATAFRSDVPLLSAVMANYGGPIETASRLARQAGRAAPG